MDTLETIIKIAKFQVFNNQNLPKMVELGVATS